jgi:signal transduction histidine kinase
MTVNEELIKDATHVCKRKAGKEKLKMLGELISGITHEINTPMHYLENNLTFLKFAFKDLLELDLKYQQILKKVKNGEKISDTEWQSLSEAEKEAEPEYLKEEGSQALDQSLEGVAMVSRLVLALKDFSHPSLHSFSLTDINKCVDTVCTISRHEWNRVAELELNLARDLPYLFASRDELHQVLLNLVVNAAHAIGEKISAGKYDRGQIKISTKTNEEKIEIAVSDNGPGIPTENLDLIFQQSFTTKEAGKGTGIGLGLVKQIVEDAHRGQIVVSSNEQSGTTFTIILPHRQNDAEL